MVDCFGTGIIGNLCSYSMGALTMLYAISLQREMINLEVGTNLIVRIWYWEVVQCSRTKMFC